MDDGLVAGALVHGQGRGNETCFRLHARGFCPPWHDGEVISLEMLKGYRSGHVWCRDFLVFS